MLVHSNSRGCLGPQLDPTLSTTAHFNTASLQGNATCTLLGHKAVKLAVTKSTKQLTPEPQFLPGSTHASPPPSPRHRQGLLQSEKTTPDLAIETIELLLQGKYGDTGNRLGQAQVLQLMKFCLRTYFLFDGTIFEQVKETPMGSPISEFIVEAVMQRLESLVFQRPRQKFWGSYVEDTFVVIEPDQVLTFKERLNSVFPGIQFAMEEEENNQMAFLDILVCRKDCGGLKTKMFRKATNTTQILNFNGNYSISHKRSCARTLRRRVETHCIEPEDKVADCIL
ncbi:hypothetical protein SprV_0502015000 [Sparganum proliferum]